MRVCLFVFLLIGVCGVVPATQASAVSGTPVDGSSQHRPQSHTGRQHVASPAPADSSPLTRILSDADGDTDVSFRLFEEAEALRRGMDGKADLAEAIQLYEEAARRNTSAAGAALCALAVLHEEGVDGVIDQDLYAAVALYNRSANLGNATAQFNMGVLHAHGLLGVPHDEAAAVLLYYFAALGGSPEAHMALGYRHHQGVTVPKRCSTAVLYYELAANKAMEYVENRAFIPPLVNKYVIDDESIGRLGDTRAKDNQIVAYYQNMAEKGDSMAVTMLGQLAYYGGRGTNQDFEKAARLFRDAAESGDAVAATNLGHMYIHGLGVDADPETARAFLQQGLEKGEPAALNGIGFLHLHGLGVPKDHKKALDYLNRAAQGGSADASYNLALLHLAGTVVPSRDFRKAQSNLNSAINQHHVPATYKLAQMALHGIGSNPSCMKAVTLFQRVAKKGPWLYMFDRAYHKLADGNTVGALVEYLRVAEMGYVQGQTNAAYILDRIIVPVLREAAPVPEESTPAAAAPTTAGGAGEDGADRDGAVDAGSSAAADVPSAAAESAAVGADGSVEGGVPAGGDADSSTTPIPKAPGLATPETEPTSVADPATSVADTAAASDPVVTAAAGQVHVTRNRTMFGVPAAEFRAMRMYRRASDQQDVVSLVKLGDYHWYGRAGLSASKEEAARMYRRAADEGRHAQALFNLGYMHEHGLGLRRDLHLAKRYYDQAGEADSEATVPVLMATTKLWLVTMWEQWLAGDDAAEAAAGGASGGSGAGSDGGGGGGGGGAQPTPADQPPVGVVQQLTRIATRSWDSAEAVVASAAARVFMTSESLVLTVLCSLLGAVVYVRLVRRAHLETMYRRRLALLALGQHRQARRLAMQARQQRQQQQQQL